MEKNTAGLKGAFARRYLERVGFFTNFFPTAGGHLPGERDLLAANPNCQPTIIKQL